jgi:hypothetical protein
MPLMPDLVRSLREHNARALSICSSPHARGERRLRLTFDDRHERVIKPDGTASIRRVMELDLIVMETS